MEDIHSKLDRLDTDYTMLEEDFYGKVSSKAMEIEQLDPYEV